MPETYHIALVEPFFGGSHQQWAEGLKEHSRHNIDIFSLPGRHWKWRMHGAAVTLAQEVLANKKSYDLFLCSDMMDVALFSALLRHEGMNTPIALYFHENQLTYPWSPDDDDVKLNRDRHYGWINYTSCLVAEKIWFNSHYHLQSFTQVLPDYLKGFPDARNTSTIEDIKNKSSVLPLGLDLTFLLESETEKTYGPPVLLWNHRWEYDKNPEAFFLLCRRLKAHGFDFRIIVAGEHQKRYPAIFDVAEKEFAEEIIHWGYATSKMEYRNLLMQADIVPVTSNQDFFGASAVEAIAAGCLPLLPNRLAYAEHIPEAYTGDFIYTSSDELYEKTMKLADGKPDDVKTALREYVARYDWQNMISHYDDKLQE